MSSKQSANENVDSPPKTSRLSAPRKVFFALATVVLFFILVEGLLRVAGFRVVSDVERMEFTFPIDDYNNNAPEPFLRRDPELFWTPRPGVLGHNSQGFYGPEFSPQKPPGVFRIVCIGDSCTHFGPHSYPEILQQRLADRIGDRKVEVINAGVIGYTSYQGLQLMLSRVKNWQPDLVTVYFGWNDHWLARGVEDKYQSVDAGGGLSGLMNDLRCVQLARMLTGGLKNDGSAKVRVALTDYRENLIEIANLADSIGSECWLITAPHAMDLSIPDYLLTSGEVDDPSKLIPMHQSYNDVVREVAVQTGSSLVDLESKIDAIPKQSLFVDDHIHLTLEGREFAAKQIAEAVVSAVDAK